MKNLFIIWITIQLMLIGISSLSIENDISKGTYECGRSIGNTPLFMGSLFPLVYFTSDDIFEKINKYCEK